MPLYERNAKHIFQLKYFQSVIESPKRFIMEKVNYSQVCDCILSVYVVMAVLMAMAINKQIDGDIQ